MDKLTPEQLAEITNRQAKASPAPWNCQNEYIVCCDVLHVAEVFTKSNAEFIIASRTDIPALLDHIKVLEEENARYKDTLSKIIKRREDDGLYDIIWAIAHEAIKPQNGVIADIRRRLKGADEE